LRFVNFVFIFQFSRGVVYLWDVFRVPLGRTLSSVFVRKKLKNTKPKNPKKTQNLFKPSFSSPGCGFVVQHVAQQIESCTTNRAMSLTNRPIRIVTKLRYIWQ